MTMTVSDKATEQLKDELMQKVLNTGLGYRIICISNSPESGNVTFGMELDRERPGDEVIASHRIRIFLAPADAVLLRDYELDYPDPTNGFRLKGKLAMGGS